MLRGAIPSGDISPRYSLIDAANRLQARIEERLARFWRWVGPFFFVFLLSLSVFVWAFISIMMYAVGVLPYPHLSYSNGLDFLVNGPEIPLYWNPILYFIISGVYFMVLLLKLYYKMMRK